MDGDEQLVRRAKGGDADALRDLVRAHQEPIHALLARLVGPEEAEDLGQETFLRAFRALPRFREGEGSFRGWLLTIATRVGIDFLRRHREALRHEDQFPCTKPSPEAAAGHQALAARVHEALSEENPTSRAAFLLHAYHGMSDSEIGSVLRVKAPTVRSRIHCTKKRLRRALADETPEGRGAVRGAR